jgi:hypothetical protein
MSVILYSFLNFWFILILHIPCSATRPYILLNIFLSYLLLILISISLTAQVSLSSGFTIALDILILTALLMARDLNIYLRLEKHLLNAAILASILSLTLFYIYQDT